MHHLTRSQSPNQSSNPSPNQSPNPSPNQSPYPSLLHHRLRVWHRAVELVMLIHAHPIGDAELRDQANRAARSTALNIAEGAAVRGAAKRRHFVIARGSVVEVAAAYELAAALGESLPQHQVEELASMLSAMLTGLIGG